MIIYCEECGAKNILSAKELEAREILVKCKACNDYLWNFKKVQTKHEKARETTVTTSRLQLAYKDTSITLQDPAAKVNIGRHEKCDIRIKDLRVSRIHARIEYRKGKYILTDQSLNGTYILVAGRQGITIKNEELMLVNKGVIGLGHRVDFDSEDAIRFQIMGGLQ